MASHVYSPLFLAHIRASAGTAVQQTNCHPFRHGRWLWVLQQVSDETRIAVSEPLVDLPGAWNEVPESSYGGIQ